MKPNKPRLLGCAATLPLILGVVRDCYFSDLLTLEPAGEGKWAIVGIKSTGGAYSQLNTHVREIDGQYHLIFNGCP